MSAAALLAAFAMLSSASQEESGDASHGRQPLPAAEVIAALPADGGPDFNRLVFSKSPYLLQHARNPVDWHEWGPEPFRLAQERSVPVFLSIGYSTCHWCHVMEHESFEDEEVAQLMNEAFVCIKLDREERPDIDQLYMTVTQSMTGRGGWPMTVVMTPDKKPFFAGTYFPRITVGQRYGMLQLVPALSSAWNEQREEVVASADEMTQQLRAASGGAPGAMLGEPALLQAEAELSRSFDAVHGGFGSRPKFPVPHQLRFLLRRYDATGDAATLAMVTRTLEAWRLGGIFDQVGLGMHRYSTDERYLLPHFEKMLYDQALCALAYVDAWQVTKDPAHQRAAREILEYVARDMTSPEGGFYSAEDADSEGEEGLFYIWTTAEVRALLGEADGNWVVGRFGLTDEGNFRDESTGRPNGRSIPHLSSPLSDEERARWEPLRRRLFDVRDARVHPLKDDKVLTDWNGLAIEAFARAGRAFGDESLVARATRAADFLRSSLVNEDGRLLKRWRAGEAGLDAMLDDHAYVASGLLALFEAGHDPAQLQFARQIVDQAIAHFWDEEAGGFFLSPDDGEALIVRAKETYDGARPSGNSAMAVVLTRLARLSGEPRYEELAVATVEAFSAGVGRGPSSSAHMLGAVDAHVRGAREIVLVGTRGDDETEAMLNLLAERFAPNDVFVLRPPGAASDEPVQRLVAAVPYAAPLVQIEGRATAYVCSNFTCEAPVATLAKLEALLSPAKLPGKPAEAPAEGGDAEGGQ